MKLNFLRTARCVPFVSGSPRKGFGNLTNDDPPKRDELIETLRAKLRALFPDSTPYAEEKRAEVLAYVAEEVLGRPETPDIAAAADLPLVDLAKLSHALNTIDDAH